MQKINTFRRAAVAVLTALAVLSASGCAGHTASTSSNSKYASFITVDVYDSLANDSGIRSGWYAKIIREKFNMELNIITPNTSGSADTLYDTRFAAGDVGDLIICSSSGGRLQSLVNAGLVLNMEPYLHGTDLMSRYEVPIRSLNRNITQDGIYAIPSSVSSASPYTPSEDLAANYGAYLRWDYYSEIGYPAISTLEDLLPVLAEMQEKHPYSDSGEPVYAFSFFKDWDNNMMNAIKQPCCFYGYDETGFVLAKADGSDFQNILDGDSLYMRVLRFYNRAFRMGLVDPDSPNQTYNGLSQKFKDGQILFSPWPWLAQPAYNTTDKMSLGMGYMFVPIEDELIYSYGCKSFGNYQTVIAVGSRAEDPERLADFISWLYSPEGIMISCCSPHQGTPGPEGLTWRVTEGGPELTEFGKAVLLNGDLEVPDEWGGGMWWDGACMLNYTPVSKVEQTPDGYPYYFAAWDSLLRQNRSALEKDWARHMNADTVMEYLQNSGHMIVSPGTDYISPDESTELSTIRTQCADTIVSYSWKMVYAESDEEFEGLYSELLSRTKALGYSQIYRFDLENAREEAKAKADAALPQ
ncbi:MAG: extracellular solute-binding protein [Butyrivibrio sp.]|nr:extracellular solute-binding protein [Butyrivibrio sp.]